MEVEGEQTEHVVKDASQAQRSTQPPSLMTERGKGGPEDPASEE